MKETNLGRVGLLLSAAYLAILIVGVCLSSSMGWIEWKTLEINQLGDFLAGAFGPLALGWLVLGFFQQGRELKNSVETLRLQAQELRNSVEQQRKLVEATREQINFEQDQIGSGFITRT